jgi:hypothetical protein
MVQTWSFFFKDLLFSINESTELLWCFWIKS